MPIDKKWVGVKEAAEELGCTDSNVRKLINSGVLDVKQLTPHVRLILRKSLDEYAAKDIRVGRPRKKSEKNSDD